MHQSFALSGMGGAKRLGDLGIQGMLHQQVLFACSSFEQTVVKWDDVTLDVASKEWFLFLKRDKSVSWY